MYRNSGFTLLVCLLGLALPACSKKKPAPAPAKKEAISEKEADRAALAGEEKGETRATTGEMNSTHADEPLSPAVQKAVEETGTSPALAFADKEYEAWFKKYHLDLNDPNMLDADPDGDGFTNREEFLSGTNPLDPNSRPGELANIKMKGYTKIDFPVVLRSVEGGSAQIEHTGETGDKKLETIKAGQGLRNSPYKVTQVRSQRAFDKDGHPIDASRVMLEDPASRQRVELVKDLPARSTSSYATLTSPDGKTTITVHEGDTFAWPDKPGISYVVKDLRAEQVILEQVDTKQMWTVRMQ